MNRHPPVPPPPVHWSPRSRTGAAVQRMALTVGNVDATIRRSMGIILVRKEGLGAAPLVLPSLESAVTSFAALPDGETLYLDGHGAAPDNLGVPGTAAAFGGLTPEQLADRLISKGLNATYTGKIYLNGCNTANDSTGEAYAARFQKAMAARNRFVRVKGNAGYSQVQDDGKTRVAPPTAPGAAERVTLNRLVADGEALQQEVSNLLAEVQNSSPSSLRLAAIRSRLDEIRIAAPVLRGQIDAQHLVAYLGTKALRPTLVAPAERYYEHSAGTYNQVPAAIGRSGQTLLHHVTQALGKYGRRWKISKSAASTAAVAVLQNLVDHTALFMAVSYYLFAARPRPPVSIVAVGAKLSLTSSLYADLSEEFGKWC